MQSVYKVLLLGATVSLNLEPPPPSLEGQTMPAPSLLPLAYHASTSHDPFNPSPVKIQVRGEERSDRAKLTKLSCCLPNTDNNEPSFRTSVRNFDPPVNRRPISEEMQEEKMRRQSRQSSFVLQRVAYGCKRDLTVGGEGKEWKWRGESVCRPVSPRRQKKRKKERERNKKKVEKRDLDRSLRYARQDRRLEFPPRKAIARDRACKSRAKLPLCLP